MNIKRNIKGKFTKNAIWVNPECFFCHKKFFIKESQLKYGRGKYCSRKCCDEHKKVICVGEGNGAFGRKIGDIERKQRSEITAQSWKNPIIKKRRENGIERFVKAHGHYPGADPASLLKRKETLIKKYGVDHIWKLNEARRRCEDTCFKRYGKHTWEIAREALQLYSTEIEIKTKAILEKNNIPFESQYEIPFNGSKKIYDFFIPSSNLLIEVDGDFWHGNPIMFPENTLLEVQRINRENDLVKNDIAKHLGFKLLRFWEHEVQHLGFEKRLLSLL